MFNIKDVEIDKDMVFVSIFTIILLFILDKFSKLIMTDEKKDYSNNDLLEFPNNYKFKNIGEIDNNNILYKILEDYVNTFKDFNFIVSLSGGVDSMVLLYILLQIVDKNKIATASINYNQRPESSAELKFIEEYLYNLNLVPYSRTVENISRKKEQSDNEEKCNRKEFEETSQKIRFDLYKDILIEKNWSKDNTIILLGHHLDDLRENIFNNFMLGRKLLDLEVMSKICEKDNLYFGRPFLDISKSEIYNVSHENNIPYFKDTTPDWSKRGLMRRQLFPLLNQIYPGFERKLDIQGEESNNLKDLINNQYVKNFLKVINVDEKESEILFSWDIYFDKNVNNPIVWREMLSNIIHKCGNKMISQKSFKVFLENKEKRDMRNFYMLSKNVGIKRLKEKSYLLVKKKILN